MASELPGHPSPQEDAVQRLERRVLQLEHRVWWLRTLLIAVGIVLILVLIPPLRALAALMIGAAVVLVLLFLFMALVAWGAEEISQRIGGPSGTDAAKPIDEQER